MRKIRQPVLFMWFVGSVSFGWLNQMDEIDRINQTDHT